MKLGLCFSGGGARGAYQIGACVALKEAGILDKVEVFSGTSIGAANAAMIAACPLDKVRNVWFDIPEETLNRTEHLFKKLFTEPGTLVSEGIYETSKLEKVLRDNLDMNNLKNKKVFVTISDAGEANSGFKSLVKSTYRHYIRREPKVVYTEIGQHDKELAFKEILASCSIPIVFSPTCIDGKQYFDGGLYDNVPVKPLVDAGCDTIIVLHLDRLPYFYKQRYKNIVFHPIKSHHSLGWHLKFAPDQSVTRYTYGYNDCKRYLENNKII